jgi:hypothetical protein
VHCLGIQYVQFALSSKDISLLAPSYCMYRYI